MADVANASDSVHALRYIRAGTLPAIAAALGDGFIPLAGGTVLVPFIAQGAIDAPGIVDIRAAAPLAGIAIESGAVDLGAGATLGELAAHPGLQAHCRALAQAAHSIGNPNVRRSGTLGGNVASRLATADLIPALLVLEAQADCISPDGEFTSPVADLVSAGLRPHSVIARIRISILADSGSAFVKFGWRRASAKSIITVAARLRLRAGAVEDLHLAVSGITAHACRLPKTEASAAGQSWSTALIESLAKSSANEMPAQFSGPPSEWYRRRLISAGVREILAQVGRA